MGFWSKAARGVGQFLTGDPGGAREKYQQGMGRASEQISGAYEQARPRYTTTMAKGGGELSQGYDTAQQKLGEGYSEAQSQYKSAPMVATKGELTRRILGQGGLSADVMGQQRAGTVEDYGTALKAAKQGLRGFGGQAKGLKGELFARNVADVGASRAKALRDMSVGNERLKREEMTGAMGMAPQLAAAEASLATEKGKALAGMAEARGKSMAQFANELATGEASLTVEEAKALSELEAATAGGVLSTDTQKGLLSSLF